MQLNLVKGSSNKLLLAAELEEGAVAGLEVTVFRAKGHLHHSTRVAWYSTTVLGWHSSGGTVLGWRSSGGTVLGWHSSGGTVLGWHSSGGTVLGWHSSGGIVLGWHSSGGTVQGD